MTRGLIHRCFGIIFQCSLVSDITDRRGCRAACRRASPARLELVCRGLAGRPPRTLSAAQSAATDCTGVSLYYKMAYHEIDFSVSYEYSQSL